MVGWVIREQFDGKNDPKRQQPVDKERMYIKFISIEIAFDKAPNCFINFTYLFILFLVTILSQSLFTLMRSHFMALSFFTRRHTSEFFLINLLIRLFL
jgi:hypothetical protein